MKLITWSLSDVGKKRDHNEDSYLVDDRVGLFAVADGMGGHQGGDRASRMAVEILRREIAAAGEFEEAAARLIELDPSLADAYQGAALPPDDPASVAERVTEEIPIEDLRRTVSSRGDRRIGPPPVPAAATVLRAAARSAGRAIYDTAQSDPHLSGMGTTLTALLVHKDRAHLAHVGDSRAFLYRDGRIEQITEDHSWIAEQVKAGVMSEEEAKESKFRHIITRSVGFEREVDVDLLGVPVLPGDCFLLCSDGMSNYVETEELGRILGMTYYRKVPRLLVELANDRGGDDNITVVLVYVANDKS